jgi:DNA-binding MarR family transcriptional regulator
VLNCSAYRRETEPVGSPPRTPTGEQWSCGLSQSRSEDRGSDAARDWLAELTRSITSVTRQAHSIRLYDAMGTRAGLSVRPYLFGVLARIRDLQPVRISDVADEMDYDRSTVSRHVTELTQLGCVERMSLAADGRVVMLRLTKEGEDVVARVFEAWMDSLGEITAEWSPSERETFLHLLARFDRSFTEHVADL